MGFDADAVDRMSLWQFLAAQGGMERAHGSAGGEGLSDQEVEELWDFVKS